MAKNIGMVEIFWLEAGTPQRIDVPGSTRAQPPTRASWIPRPRPCTIAR